MERQTALVGFMGGYSKEMAITPQAAGNVPRFCLDPEIGDWNPPQELPRIPNRMRGQPDFDCKRSPAAFADRSAPGQGVRKIVPVVIVRIGVTYHGSVPPIVWVIKGIPPAPEFPNVIVPVWCVSVRANADPI